MANESSNLVLVTADINNLELLTNGRKKDLKTNNKLKNSQMLDPESEDTFSTQDLDLNYNLLKKKRKKKITNDDMMVKHCENQLKTDSSNLELVYESKLPTNVRKSLNSDLIKEEEMRKTLKEIPTNKPPSSPMLGPKYRDTFSIQDLNLPFNLLKKKRKKKVSNNDLFVEHDDVQSKIDSSHLPCNADTDYNYEDLLKQIYNIIGEKNSKYKSENRKVGVMKPPQVIRIGTRKTSFVNFLDFCNTLHRRPQHLHSYILAELATYASIDSNNQLIIRGRFEQRQIETVLKHYIKEYVTCHACHSFDTILQKDSRLCFLHCESCGSRWSVAGIKSGFQAVTSNRAAERAKVN